jgi:hypothetical protein
MNLVFLLLPNRITICRKWYLRGIKKAFPVKRESAIRFKGVVVHFYYNEK